MYGDILLLKDRNTSSLITAITEWHKKFREGRVSQDDVHPGQAQRVNTPAIIADVEGL